MRSPSASTTLPLPIAATGGRMPARRRAARGGPPLPRWSLWLALAGIALGLAVASLALQHGPNFDPWGWIVWGRGILHLRLDTAVGPSWKPGPVVFTTIFALFGGLAPSLWLITARCGALLAVVLAYRLAARRGGALGGSVAAVLVALTEHLFPDALYGQADPLTAGLLLWGVDRALAERPRQAIGLLLLASLMRPEVLVVLLAYGAWLWRVDRVLTAWAVAATGVFVALWFGGDWWGSGHPLMASAAAKQFAVVNAKYHHAHPALATVQLAGHLLSPVPLLLAVLALAIGAYRRDRLVLGLALVQVALLAAIAAMAQDGYPVIDRFLFSSTAVGYVLAGIAVGGLARMASRWHVLVAVVVAAALLGALAPGIVFRARAWGGDARSARHWSAELTALPRVIAAAGGSRRILACRDSITTYYLMRGALAWDLGTDLPRTFDWPHDPNGILFLRRGDRLTHPQPHRPLRTRTLATAAGWRAVAIATRRRAMLRC